MRRILFVGNFLSRSKGTINPSEKLVSKLRAEGYRISIASSFQNTGLRLLSILHAALFSRYDCVHIDVFSGKALWFATLSARIARHRKKYVILDLHGGRLPEVYVSKKSQINSLLNRADKIISPSNYLKDFFGNEGFIVDYIPNAIDSGTFSYLWDPTALDKKSILWVRSFSPIYRPMLAIDVLRDLRVKFPNVSLTMIGPDGGLLRETLSYIDKLGLRERVMILPPVNNNDLPQYFSSHSVFLNTTEYESFGMAVLESIACGLPVVSSAVGELPKLWQDGEEVLLVNGSSSKSFAARIEKLFCDRSFAISMSAKAYSKVQRFEWEHVKKKWFGLFDKK